MKYIKMFGLLAVTAVAMMGFAGSASAATLTAPTGTEYTGAFTASLEGSALLKASFAEITCTSSTVGGTVTTNNESVASGDITTVDFSNCGSATVTTLNHNGTLSIAKGTRAVSGTGVEVTVFTAGTDCIYGLGAGTSLGTATNIEPAGTDGVTLPIKAKLKKLTGSGFLCAAEAEWTANYIITNPVDAHID
jgi:hypothetical protein